VPLVLLERSCWAGFNGIYLVKFGFRMWEILIFKWFLPLKIQINSKNQVFEGKISWERCNTWWLTIQFKHDSLSYLAVQKIQAIPHIDTRIATTLYGFWWTLPVSSSIWSLGTIRLPTTRNPWLANHYPHPGMNTVIKREDLATMTFVTKRILSQNISFTYILQCVPLLSTSPIWK
jgi:hypothetical protein